MVLAELAAYLEAQGLGTQATTIFYGLLPATPDTLITLLEYPGKGMEPKMGGTTVNIEWPRVQIIARGAKEDYDGPRLKINQVVQAMVAIREQLLSGVQYHAAIPIQSPDLLKRDENFRCLFKCNFEIMKDLSTS